MYLLKRLLSSTRVFLVSQLTKGKTTALTVNRLVQIISHFQCRGGQNVSRMQENREQCLEAGPHLFTLWAQTCQQLSFYTSRSAFLSPNQCSFGRCVSKCHLKSNNCFLPFSFRAACLQSPRLQQAIKATVVFAKGQTMSFCFFTTLQELWSRSVPQEANKRRGNDKLMQLVFHAALKSKIQLFHFVMTHSPLPQHLIRFTSGSGDKPTQGPVRNGACCENM